MVDFDGHMIIHIHNDPYDGVDMHYTDDYYRCPMIFNDIHLVGGLNPSEKYESQLE